MVSKGGKVFEVRPEHLKLLRRMHVGWNDIEYGAPEIDPKRPYGNSSVENDVREILCAPNLGSDKVRELHREMQTVLQILVSTGGQIEPFTTYVTSGDYLEDWREATEKDLAERRRRF